MMFPRSSPMYALTLDPSWAGVLVAVIGGAITYAIASLIWAVRQSSRIDRMEDRVKACETKASEQQTNAQQLDDRLRSIDSKLSRLMGRLGMPVRSGDDMEVE